MIFVWGAGNALGLELLIPWMPATGSTPAVGAIDATVITAGASVQLARDYTLKPRGYNRPPNDYTQKPRGY